MKLYRALLWIALASVRATAQLLPGPGDPRIQSVDYQPDQVVQLQAAPGYQVTVLLSPDEQIETVAVGDSGAWQVVANKRGDSLFVKPVRPGIATNMTVVTDARVYAFELLPMAGLNVDMVYTLRFRYPAPANATLAGPPPAEAVTQGRYKLSGDRTIRPAAIHDDGTHTYLEWPPYRPLPAIYAIDAQGRESLVNGSVREGLFVIDTVAKQLVFRVDDRIAGARRIVPRRGR